MTHSETSGTGPGTGPGDKAKPLADNGAYIAGTPAEASAGADIVLGMLATPRLS